MHQLYPLAAAVAPHSHAAAPYASHAEEAAYLPIIWGLRLARQYKRKIDK